MAGQAVYFGGGLGPLLKGVWEEYQGPSVLDAWLLCTLAKNYQGLTLAQELEREE